MIATSELFGEDKLKDLVATTFGGWPMLGNLNFLNKLKIIN